MDQRELSSKQVWLFQETDGVGGAPPHVNDYVNALVRDITEAKENRRMLEEQNNLQATQNQELDTFSHSVAHDLKNPLSLIIGYAEMLKDDSVPMTAEEHRDFVDTILFNARRMNAIINALLLLSSVRKDDVGMYAVNMEVTVQEVLRRLRHVIGERDATITLPKAWIQVRGYAPWIEEVWINYFSSALKYGGTPCDIVIGVDDLGETVRYWIRDNGVGFPQEELESMYNTLARFSELNVEGYGLGLSIVARIVQKIGGTVSAESTVGEGSTFSFTLPKA